MVFTLTGASGQPLTEAEARALPPSNAPASTKPNKPLRAEIIAFAQTLRPLERVRDDALNDLRKRTVRPWCSKPWPPCAAPCPNNPRAANLAAASGTRTAAAPALV